LIQAKNREIGRQATYNIPYKKFYKRVKDNLEEIPLI